MERPPDSTMAFSSLVNHLGGTLSRLDPLRLHGIVTALALVPWEEAPRDILDDMAAPPFDPKADPAAMALLEKAVAVAFDALFDNEWSPAIPPDLAPPRQTERLGAWYTGMDAVLQARADRWAALEGDNPLLNFHMDLLKGLAGFDTATPRFETDGAESGPPDTHRMGRLAEILGALAMEAADAQMNLEEVAAIRGGLELPAFDDAELAGRDAADILQLLVELKDAVPRNVFDAALARGRELLPRIIALTEDPLAWGDERPAADPEPGEKRWWALHHGIHLLGELRDDRAAGALLDVLLRMDRYPDDVLWEWFTMHWPALFANKRATALPVLETVMADPARDTALRVTAMECVTGLLADDPDALDERLDRIAGIIGDAPFFSRLQEMGVHVLLDHPRERHRALLLRIAAAYDDDELFRPFDAGDVEDAFSPQADRPWTPSHHLDFYDPGEITRRQIRWVKENVRDSFDTSWTDRLADAPSAEPYVRETPKIGRNDPCPCGSGRKYKKCCMK